MANYRANLSDVAEEAGVSKSTVSRVLNNKLGNGFSVREEVRLMAAEQDSYSLLQPGRFDPTFRGIDQLSTTNP